MEHYVIMEKLCSCAKKEGLEKVSVFEDKESAGSAAKAQLQRMQSSFCGKHEFDLTEVEDHFVIGMLSGCGCGSSKDA